MKDGWHNGEYFALYETKEESLAATERYRIAEYLPGLFVVGLKFWDDFILSDTHSQYFTVPTVPLVREYLQPYAFPSESLKLRSHPKLAGKIKWYIQPLVFGGAPTEEKNTAWISHDQHVEAVVHWNRLYRDLAGKTANKSPDTTRGK